MNLLLLSMPDSFEHMPPVAIRMPNGALASLAGNVDDHHRVSIADLILVQSSVASTVERLVRDLAPDVVGLSVMTFQRTTALRIARMIRALRPAAASLVHRGGCLGRRRIPLHGLGRHARSPRGEDRPGLSRRRVTA